MLIKEYSEEILNGMPGIFITRMEEVNIGQRSSDQLGEGKSLYVRRFRSMCCRVEQGSGATERWKGHVEDLRMYSSYQDAVGIDGEAIEFE